MEKLITRKEAAKILGISIATLDVARNNSLISYVQYCEGGVQTKQGKHPIINRRLMYGLNWCVDLKNLKYQGRHSVRKCELSANL